MPADEHGVADVLQRSDRASRSPDDAEDANNDQDK